MQFAAYPNKFTEFSFQDPRDPKDPSGYPIYYFPEKIRNAILEVWQETQAPLPLVATSALSALSIACQHLFDAGRPKGMTSPCSLFFITIADSGERKTSSDRFFTKPIREFENRHTEENKKQHATHEVDLEIWKAKETGIKRKLQKLVSQDKNCESAECELRQHHEHRPVQPAKMRMLFDDVSPTAIVGSLQNNWPSVGILSDEAGKLFNSKTFENIGLFNKLWDGDTVSLDRHRTSDSYTVPDGRLTVSLMSQQKTFSDFLKKQGNLARDNGFLARCLVCKPISTQGYRQSNSDQPPLQNTYNPNLDQFHLTIEKLLHRSWQNHQTKSQRTRISMSDEAVRCWTQYFNNIESKLPLMGHFFDVQDGASKIAENIARMACLFQAFECFEHEINWQINASMVNAAHAICMWYMDQFKMIFGQQSVLSEEVKNAGELMAWLERIWAQRGLCPIKKNDILQFGPNKIRNKNALEQALTVLQNQQQISINSSPTLPGKKSIMYINKYLSYQLPR